MKLTAAHTQPCVQSASRSHWDRVWERIHRSHLQDVLGMSYLCVCARMYMSMCVWFVREDAGSQASTDRKALLVKLSARVPTMCVNCRCGSMSRDEFMCCIRERHSYVCALCVTFFFFGGCFNCWERLSSLSSATKGTYVYVILECNDDGLECSAKLALTRFCLRNLRGERKRICSERANRSFICLLACRVGVGRLADLVLPG